MTLKIGVWSDGWWMYAGDTNRETFTFTGEQTVDLTGCTVQSQVREQPEDELPALSALCTVDGDTAVVSYDGEDVRAWLGGQRQREGVVDVQIIWPDGAVETFYRDRCVAQMDVTRPEVQ